MLLAFVSQEESWLCVYVVQSSVILVMYVQYNGSRLVSECRTKFNLNWCIKFATVSQTFNVHCYVSSKPSK
jgi:hypothetical protein